MDIQCMQCEMFQFLFFFSFFSQMKAENPFLRKRELVTVCKKPVLAGQVFGQLFSLNGYRISAMLGWWKTTSSLAFELICLHLFSWQYIQVSRVVLKILLSHCICKIMLFISFRIQIWTACVSRFSSWRPVPPGYRWNVRVLCCLATLSTWHSSLSRLYSVLMTSLKQPNNLSQRSQLNRNYCRYV